MRVWNKGWVVKIGDVRAVRVKPEGIAKTQGGKSTPKEKIKNAEKGINLRKYLFMNSYAFVNIP